jgi:hypothetical protein
MDKPLLDNVFAEMLSIGLETRTECPNNDIHKESHIRWRIAFFSVPIPTQNPVLCPLSGSSSHSATWTVDP